MDQVHVIRHKVLVEGLTVRQVARQLGISRNTVKRYLELPSPMRVESKPRATPVLDQVGKRIEAILSDSPRWTGGKQRLTATRLHRMLRGEGFDVGVTLVKQAVAEWRRRRREVFVPLVYHPGDLGEVDFFEVLVDLAGRRTKAWMFVLRLMHSGRDFARLYTRQDQVSFLDGHVRALAHIAWVTVGAIIERVVARKLDQDRLEQLYVIGIDEVSYRKGHKYLRVIADHRTGDPAWIAEGRSRETVGKFFDELGPERSQQVAVVTMDMCAAYIEEVKARAPNAHIAFDPFHVVKLANEAVHDVRRTEARDRKGSTEATVLKGSRWALLKAPENLRPVERVRLAEVATLNARVYRSYLLKEELRALYQCGHRAASTHLDAWLSWASRSKLNPFVKLAATLRKYRDGVLAAIRLGLSNGRLEGLNNKIGMLKHRAFGFHSAAALIAMIFLCCTKLHLELPT